ncbi:hypothetical protein O3G_MSEX011184 [Manduca sexta]|uniref:Molybdenum cofactor sulfurase n=3 Tax=Manduca sexta TaxID=7130 RepID=A0A922CV80_MANSE|nr:hypothetical protein O3G_MSEX011184 [Manduca sexta]KAG6459062.1 hypothetical protein O3G_MSEX011184 [Manduca sexta]KAG6459063.1 hypothetical protein O3G_MSEX011184 [Manduca sexta]
MSVLSHVMKFEQMTKIPLDYEKYNDQPAEPYEMNVLSQVISNEQMTKITSGFRRLGDRCYLDNAGATLYPANLLDTINDDLVNNVYMNPHTDKYTKDCLEQIRCLVLKHFNTNPSTYSVVFTSGTTQSLKLVAESFQFSGVQDNLASGSFVYLRDNHTSVLGLREIATDKNADIIHISHDDFLESLASTQQTAWRDSNDANTLFVYPAQSNFNGYKYPIDCIDKIKSGCLNHYVKKHLCKINCNWYILLDAASYVSTNKLDLSENQPDFVCMSFYKIFGFPTGLGALLIKNSSGNVLSQKRYFGGGTVDALLSDEDYHIKREILHERFEDGTVSFLSILALKHCFDNLNKLIPKVINNDLMDTISHHSYYLAKDLYQQLLLLKHNNGAKAVMLYMDSEFNDISKQGSIVTFNLMRENGTYIGYTEFQHMADLFNLSVRTGCFCNSGSCQRHLMMTNKDMKEMYKAGHRCGDEVDLIHGKPTGAIRVSFGYYNTFNDVDKLITMICKCFVKTTVTKPKRYTDYNVNETKKVIKPDKPNSIFHRLINDTAYFRDIKNILNIPHADSKIALKEISIFPIKSCGAFKIDSAWKIGPKGFEFDRDWMIIKDTGVCLTQKQNSRMCMIRPTIDLKRRLMILNFKGKEPISVPLDITTQGKFKNTSMCHSKVCTDMVKGYDCGDDVADWISEALEVSFLRLIRQADEDSRIQKKKNNEDIKLLSLSNQAQFLLINKATVRWLSKQIRDPMFTDDIDQLTDRFRGNLIIDMDEELVERDWQKVFIGKHEFKVEGQCPRCQMVCIDQQTGEKTVEPLRTISEQFGGKLRFGIYLSYVGTIDASNDNVLVVYAPIKAKADDDISR